MNYKLSPSELTYLYDGCKHCFVLKVKYGLSQPSIPMAPIFGKIGGLQKEYYSGKRTEILGLGLPAGIFTYGEKWVRSRPFELPQSASTCFINGRFDIVAALDDGSYAVLDFKTASPSEEKVDLYSRQLHAYALALENPAPGALELRPVSRLGLLFFTPDACEAESGGRQILHGEITWAEVQRNDPAFLQFLAEVVKLLDEPTPPREPDTCQWCEYRQRLASMTGSGGAHSAGSPIEISVPTCPRCHGPMRLRTGSRGDFWSCIDYPDCKGTRDA